MVTTRIIAIEYIQKQMKNIIEMFHYQKNQLHTKEDSNAGNEGQKAIRYIENK